MVEHKNSLTPLEPYVKTISFVCGIALPLGWNEGAYLMGLLAATGIVATLLLYDMLGGLVHVICPLNFSLAQGGFAGVLLGCAWVLRNEIISALHKLLGLNFHAMWNIEVLQIALMVWLVILGILNLLK